MTRDGTNPGAVTPAHPVVLLAAGPLARQVLRELPGVASALNVQISGPFGYVELLDPPDVEAPHRTVWLEPDLPSARAPEAADLSPGAAEPDDRPRPVPAAWDQRLRSLLRQLRPPAEILPFEGTPPASVQIYVVLDLRRPESIAAGLAAARSFRQEPMPLDLTGILLTGRTAQSQPDEERWRAGLAEVLRANRDTFLLHRIYLMDGRNARQEWLQTEGDHARMAAELIFHHGLSEYSQSLRQHEQARVSPRQSLDGVCGSFACRTMRSDRAAVGLAVAGELYAPLFPAERGGPPSAADVREMEGVARALGGRLRDIFLHEASDPAGPIRDALRESLVVACGDRPLGRLRAFLQSLSVEADRLMVQTPILDRRRRRRLAAEGLYWVDPPAPTPLPDRASWRYLGLLGALLGDRRLRLGVRGRRGDTAPGPRRPVARLWPSLVVPLAAEADSAARAAPARAPGNPLPKAAGRNNEPELDSPPALVHPPAVPVAPSRSRRHPPIADAPARRDDPRRGPPRLEEGAGPAVRGRCPRRSGQAAAVGRGPPGRMGAFAGRPGLPGVGLHTACGAEVVGVAALGRTHRAAPTPPRLARPLLRAGPGAFLVGDGPGS